MANTAPNPLIDGTDAFSASTGKAGGMSDLGMGQDLQQQVLDQINQRRKTALLAGNQQPAAFGALAMGTGVSGAGNTGGMALQALMGVGVMGG